MKPVWWMDYHALSPHGVEATCPYCKQVRSFDTYGEAVRAGVEHVEKCRGSE